MIILSPAFQNNTPIPKKYTCDGENISPDLKINKIPSGTKSLALIMEDSDAGNFTHWLVWSISPRLTEIPEGTDPKGATAGRNDFGKLGYGGPCPPSGSHRYEVKIYALDNDLELGEGKSRSEAEAAMGGHIIGEGELMGIYR